MGLWGCSGIVLTHRNLPVDGRNVEFYSGDLNNLLDERLKPKYKNVWMAGGAMLAKDLICLKLADEIRVSIIPIILGEGTLFFDHIGQEQLLHLKNATAYKNGIVELHYEIKK
jgi:dihydrofolate reductase